MSESDIRTGVQKMGKEIPANIFRSLSRTEKLELHIYHTRPVLNFGALYADGSDN